MPRLHRIDELANLLPYAFLLPANTGNRQETLNAGVFRGEIFGNVSQWADQSQITFPGFRNRRQRRDAAVEENVAKQRLRTIVGGVAQRENGAIQLRRNVVEMIAAVPAAHIAAVRDVLLDEFQCLRVLANHPFDAKTANTLAQRFDRALELALLHRDSDELVRKGRSFLIGDERVKQRE